MHGAKIHSFFSAGLLSLLLVGLSSSAAEWGSIRGNNRDRGETRRVEGGGERRSAPVTQAQPRVERGEEHRSAVVGRPEVRREEGRREEGRREEEHREQERREQFRVPERAREWNDYRHYDTDIDRHRGYFWWDYHAGMLAPTLPPGYLSFTLGTQPYYYYEGVYYEPSGNGYVVVAPPIGVVVPALPPGVETFVANGMVFYYAAGAFYVQQPNGYAVVPAPLGVTVTTLPPGAVPVNINGYLYYSANGVYYQPVMQAGMTVYMTVRP